MRMKRSLVVFQAIIPLIALACACPLEPFLGVLNLSPTFTISPLPTLTRIPTSTPDFSATRAAFSTQEMQNQLDELTTNWAVMGIPIDSARLEWYQEAPISIDSEGYHVQTYLPIAENITLADFILSTDVTWTTHNLVICGLIFRSGSNLELSSQYQFAFMRFSGLPAWDIGLYASHVFIYSVPGQEKYSQAINLDNGATNRIILVAQGKEFSLFINDNPEGRYQDDLAYAPPNGLFAVFAWQDTGSSNCTFSNTYLWSLNQP